MMSQATFGNGVKIGMMKAKKIGFYGVGLGRDTTNLLYVVGRGRDMPSHRADAGGFRCVSVSK